MSVLVMCDGCHDTIEPGAEFFGVDHFKAFAAYDADPVEENDHEGEGTEPIALRPMFGGHEFQFCTLGCLTTWTMSRTLDEGEGA